MEVQTLYGPCVDMLTAGQQFGEISVLTNSKRSATTIATEVPFSLRRCAAHCLLFLRCSTERFLRFQPTDFLLIPRDLFLRTVRRLKEYSSRDRILELLSKVPAFSGWPASQVCPPFLPLLLFLNLLFFHLIVVVIFWLRGRTKICAK